MNISSENQIKLAVQNLLRGDLVAVPTETVYGLGADAENPSALEKIFIAKGRPNNHPLIVHIAKGANLDYWADNINENAQKLIDAFWPGPLTLILQKSNRINNVVTGGQNTIGIRCPSHPVAQKLLQDFAKSKPNGNAGIAAPSANKFGHVSPTKAEHVRSEFPDLDETKLYILQGGASQVGIESTIIDVSQNDVPVLLRPGYITSQDIFDVLGLYPLGANKFSPQVSGSLKAHYAPRTTFTLFSTDEIINYCKNELSGSSKKVAIAVFNKNGLTDQTGIDVYKMSDNHNDYAKEMYSVLRDLDQKNYQKIIFEMPPQTSKWHAVNDRLNRAAAAFDV